jgi:pimeloyl-[acyl-carrier protein] methyl ester esterase
VRIETTGGGPPLVLLHGWAMHSGIFAPLVDRLRAHFTLHLVDLPGHGHNRDSALPLELALVADAIVDAVADVAPRATWLGWSLGGLVALQAAASRPASVRGLAMLCASPRFVRSPDWPEGMPASVFEGFAADLGRDYRATIDRFLMLEAHGSDHMREELRLLRAQVFAAGEPAPARLAEGLAVLQDSDLRALLPTLSSPSLWIAGRRDRLVAPPAMQAAAALAPGARFLRIEHGGHAPFLSHADEVAAAVLEFTAVLPA